MIFDFDGVLIKWTEEYRKWYSGTLEKVIKKERGRKGLKILKDCRQRFNGKGELALFLLNIPFRKWAQLLIEIPSHLISPQLDLVRKVKEIPAHKVIYTGSPLKMVNRILLQIGFSLRDFNWIIGWKEPELFPLKWTCSPLIFEMIREKFFVAPSKAWAIGDDWTTDLAPAQAVGMKTAGIGECGGIPDRKFPNLEEFLKYLGEEKK